MTLEIGYSFQSELKLSQKDIIDGTEFVGDTNPIHHYTDHSNKRFSGIIASGSHVMALFSGMIPAHFSEYGDLLGLEFNVKFCAPVYPDIPYIMKWQIGDKVWNEKLHADVLTLEGNISDPQEEIALLGKAYVGIFPAT